MGVGIRVWNIQARLARLAGISSRTLRYYDEIGLLRPARINHWLSDDGKEEVDRLQQFYLS